MLGLVEIYQPLFHNNGVRLVSETRWHELPVEFSVLIQKLLCWLKPEDISETEFAQLKHLHSIGVLQYVEDTPLDYLYWKLLGYSTEYIRKQRAHNTVQIADYGTNLKDPFKEALLNLGWPVQDDGRVVLLLIPSHSVIDKALDSIQFSGTTIPIVLSRYRATVGPVYYPGILDWPELAKRAESSPYYIKEATIPLPVFARMQMANVALATCRSLMCMENIAGCFIECDLTTMRIKERHVG